MSAIHIAHLPALLVIVGLGSYLQALMGFGFGLMVLGLATSFDVIPISFAAAIISLLSFFSATLNLKGATKHINWSFFKIILSILFPTIGLGLLLFSYLSSKSILTVKCLLGFILIITAMIMIRKPKPLDKFSSKPLVLLAGASSGLMNGLFSIGGPPLAFLMYRQPCSISMIKSTILAIFLVMTASRAFLIGIEGKLTLSLFITVLLCIPIVWLSTQVGKRYPLIQSESGQRQLAFFILSAIGSCLMAVSLHDLFVSNI